MNTQHSNFSRTESNSGAPEKKDSSDEEDSDDDTVTTKTSRYSLIGTRLRKKMDHLLRSVGRTDLLPHERPSNGPRINEVPNLRAVQHGVVEVRIPSVSPTDDDKFNVVISLPKNGTRWIKLSRSIGTHKIMGLGSAICWFRDPGISQTNYQELISELLYWGVASPVYSSEYAWTELRPTTFRLMEAAIDVYGTFHIHRKNQSSNEHSENDRASSSPIPVFRNVGSSTMSKSNPSASFVVPSSPGVTSFMPANSPATFKTARSTYTSPATFKTARSAFASPALHDSNRSRIQTIMETNEVKGPFEKLGMDYQAELKEKELIQPFDKELNWSGKGQHVVFQSKDKVPLEVLGHLGASATARVEMVRCRRVALARKTMRCKGSWNRNNVLQEVVHLQNLQHRHIVQLVGSYLQGRDFSLLMYPAADCHLGTFLEDTEDIQRDTTRLIEYGARREFLLSAFHCLASAVLCVHQNSTKHMDIKPQNILVRQFTDFAHANNVDGIPWRIYLSDFGLSRSFANQGHSQTDGPTSRTPKYCAPEVYEYESRGRASDMFSLGCVYIEMLTVIAGRSLYEFAEFRRDEDEDESFHKNLDQVIAWIEKIVPEGGTVISSEQYRFILNMISKDPIQRPSAKDAWLIPGMKTRWSSCCSKDPEPYVVYSGPPNPPDFSIKPPFNPSPHWT